MAGAIPQIAVHLGNRFGAGNLWDLYVYLGAADAPAPYEPHHGLLFVYPPIALDLFRLAGTHLFEIFLVAYVAAIAWCASEYSRLEFDRTDAILLAALGFGGLGVVSLRSGNLTVILHAVLLAAAWRHARTGNGASAVVAIAALSALIKPYFAVYCLLGVIGARDGRRAVVRVAGAWLAVGAVFALYWQFRQDDMRAFMTALSTQTLDRGDMGAGVVAGVLAIGGGYAAALAAHLATCAVLLGAAAWYVRRLPPSSARAGIALSLAYFVLTLVNPRPQPYDLFPAALSLLVAGTLAGPTYAWLIGVAGGLGLNAMRPAIEHFTVNPAAFPAVLTHPGALQVAGLAVMFIALLAGDGGARLARRPDHLAL